MSRALVIAFIWEGRPSSTQSTTETITKSGNEPAGLTEAVGDRVHATWITRLASGIWGERRTNSPLDESGSCPIGAALAGETLGHSGRPADTPSVLSQVA